MKMRMMILTAVALAVAFGAGLAGYTKAGAEETDDFVSLFAPETYEQYLPLANPSDAAMSEDYIAVADGNLLYIYDREEHTYTSYTHTVNGAGRNISRLQFTPDGRLFFSDQDTHLFRYRFESNTSQIQSNVPCATFLIEGDMLYTTAVADNTTTFYAIPHRSETLSFGEAKTVGHFTSSSGITPRMFYRENTLYCAVNSLVYAYTYNGSGYDVSLLRLAGESLVLELTSVAVFKDEIYFTVSNAYDADGLYRAALDEGCEKLLDGTGFVSLVPYGDSLYAVKGATVREIAVDEKGTASYTGYELAGASDSVNRFSDAKDIAKARDLTVTADFGNERVTVYDAQTDEYTALESGAATCVATDGEVIAAGVGNSVLLYRRGETSPYYTRQTVNAVTGIAVVYGNCYYITEHHYGAAREGTNEITRSNTPAALTSDIYGNLYVADRSGNVTRYTETEFLEFDAEGVKMNEGWTLPADFSALRADYDGNLYYLSGERICCNGASFLDYKGHEPVYAGGTGHLFRLASFTVSFEDGSVLLHYGDFVLRTAPCAPNLGQMEAEGVYASAYSTPEHGDLNFVNVRAGATGIRVDVGALSEDEPFFAYEEYGRTREAGDAVVLAQKGKFLLLALFGKNYYGTGEYDYEKGYTTALYLIADCTPIEGEWRETDPVPRYTTHEIDLAHYPCLVADLTIARLGRSTNVTLLGSVKAGDGFEFAYVETETGERGYLPLSYLSENEPLPGAPETYTLGYLKASREGVTFYRVDDRSERIVVTERTQVKVFDTHDGFYTVRLERDGVEYSAQITKNMLESGNPNALRMSIIIILCVIAVGIVATYALFVPRKKKD